MSITIDTSNLSLMIRSLSEMANPSDPDSVTKPVIRALTAKVLSKAISLTPAAKEESIIRSLNHKNSRIGIKGGPKLTKNVQEGTGGKVWLISESTWTKCNWGRKNKNGELSDKIQGSTQLPKKLPGGLAIHLIASNRRHNDRRWALYLELEARLKEDQISKETALKSRGLTKSTWLQIAKALGIDLKNVGELATEATTFRGKAVPLVGSGVELAEAAAFYIDIANSSSVLTRSRNVDGNRILQRAIEFQYNRFLKDLDNAIFEDLKRRSRRWPGVFVQ